MAVQHVQRRNDQQALRLRPPPPTLGRFIDLANAVPPGADLPDPMEGIARGRGVRRERWAAFKEVVEKFPKERFARFRKFIGPVNLGGLKAASSPIHAYVQYRILREAREVLRALARMDKADLARRRKLLGASSEILVYVRTNERGELEIDHSALLRALEGIEAARVRECAICSHIFWAGRIDQLCCTKRCANNLRQRRYRNKYYLNYKMRRYERAQQSHPQERIRRLAREEHDRQELTRLKARNIAGGRRPRLPKFR